MDEPPTDAVPLSRQMRLLWGAIVAGAAMLIVVVPAVGTDGPPAPDLADGVFYGVAVLSLLGTGFAFWVLRRLEDGEATGRPDRVRMLGVGALAAAEVPALAAAVGAFVTGNALALAFAVPFLAFAALTWPTEERVARWLGPA